MMSLFSFSLHLSPSSFSLPPSSYLPSLPPPLSLGDCPFTWSDLLTGTIKEKFESLYSKPSLTQLIKSEGTDVPQTGNNYNLMYTSLT